MQPRRTTLQTTLHQEMITSSLASKILSYIKQKRRAEEGDALAYRTFRQL